MQQLVAVVDKLVKFKNEDPCRFYSLLSDYNLPEDDEKYFRDKLIPKIYYLYDKGTLHKDLVYLSLLSSQNFVVLDKFIEYDKSVFVLNIENPVSLYDYYIYAKRHWLYEVVSNPSCCEKNTNIFTKINMINYIVLSNTTQIDIDYLEGLSLTINTSYLNTFWKNYIREVNISINTVRFCRGHLRTEADISKLFAFASKNTFLKTLSEFTNLRDSTYWEDISNKIETSATEDELNVFTGFLTMSSLIKILIQKQFNSSLKKDFVNTLLDNTKMKLINLTNKLLQIELLENIFCLLFYINENEFTCKEKEIRFILFLLKDVIEELTLKKVFEANTKELRRLQSLNRNVNDALWRLDLIMNTTTGKKMEDQLLNYMLAPAQSLICICLKHGNFNRAYEVIQIFDLRDTDLAREVMYAEKFLAFKSSLKKQRGKLTEEIINDFLTLNSPYSSKQCEQVLEHFTEKYPYITNFQATNETCMTAFDMAITEVKSEDNCELLLKVSKGKYRFDINSDSKYLKFYNKVVAVAEEIGAKKNKTVAEILISPYYSFDVNMHKARENVLRTLGQLYDDFRKHVERNEVGILNKNHGSHKVLFQINELCNNYPEAAANERETTQYLVKVFNYLEAFSKILYIEQNSSDVISKGKDASYFEILNFNRSELIGKLLFEKHLDPTDFEKYFGKLKLDFLYHIVGNCFPTINLHVPENMTNEELYHDNMLYVPSPSIIVYIQHRNWLLAFILHEMYKIQGVQINTSKDRLQTYFNYLTMPKIQYLKILFDNNDIVASLQNSIDAQKVKMYFQEQIIQQDLISIKSRHSNNSNDGFETAEEVSEEPRTTDWRKLLDLIDSIPESQIKKKTELTATMNNILVNLVQDGFEIEYYKYICFICDRNLRIDATFNSFKKWPGEFALNVIKMEISHFNRMEDAKMELLRAWLQHIELNEKLKIIFSLNSWYKSYDFCRSEPGVALVQILGSNNVDFVLEFIKLYKPSEDILLKIDASYTRRIIESNAALFKIKDLLDNLPFNHSISICEILLTVLKKLEHLQFIADYLNDNVTDSTFVKHVQVGLKMLAVFTPSEQEQLFCIISEPLNILEVVIMNTKLDKLSAIVELLINTEPYNNFTQNVITTEQIDQLLRRYAEKSLDFRVITHSNLKALKNSEYKLLQSLDSVSVISDKRQFVVPETVPTKDDWVQNDEVLECMCCHQVSFSMFNRRHHCRRCGRIICYNCSLKRMLVESYGDILVRVCTDCYNQTIGSSYSSEKSDIASTLSLLQECWLLNDDMEHNKIVREEFSFEHAPSTALCFSILKYHSKSAEYPKFLLQQCEIMLKLLQPSQELTHEIDYLLVIKMLKSLAMAAKVLSANNMNSYASMADRILSQAELLALLAERGCLNLMPLIGSQNLYVDATVLRRLRDKLLQREQWNLALEVSTKAGLDNTGVFAAWGKSCLKGGCLLLAREKFQRCLDKNSLYESSSNLSRLSDLNKSIDSLDVSQRRLPSRMSSTSTSSENRPLKDPPLLHEIIQILETNTRTINPKVLKECQSFRMSESVLSLNLLACTVPTDNAINILNRIKKLPEIASGNCSLSVGRRVFSYTSRPRIDPIFYDECLYYLKKYGTQVKLLEFYVKHGDMDKALLYTVENNVGPDIFTDIYMKCLKDGIINVLQEHMSRIDSSLDIWKTYIKQICRHLEKQQLYNCLYQLQLYIGDYVRAAMTCLRFYQDGVKNFTELANNVAYLYKAETHLKQILEQEQWVEVLSVGKISNESKDSFEERMLSNPDLVMKIDNKDVIKHINTVERQVEIVTFLSQCELAGVNTNQLLKNLTASQDPTGSSHQNFIIPTLFGSNADKLNLAVLLIICGENVEDGFEIAAKTMEDFKLRSIKVFCLSGKQLAKSERYKGITQLVNCIKSTGINDAAISNMLDEMLVQAVGTLVKANVSGTKVEDLIKLIRDKATKISAYIEAKQLKTAFFHAVKYQHTADIRRIQREAELLNMPTIKAQCQRYLHNLPHSSTPYKDL